MRTIKIGRQKDNNDYAIDDQTVSGQHAIITVMDNQSIIIRDLNSLNGTFVNNKRITSDTVLNLTDVLRLGNKIVSIQSILSTPPKTRVSPSIKQESPAIPPNVSAHKTIGRKPDNHIVITASDVSSKHAVLYKLTTGEVVITDCNSTNGTFVNGERIIKRTLQKGDKVSITRNHALDWENVFPPVRAGKGKTKKHTWVFASIAAVICIIMAFVGIEWYQRHRAWTEEDIYKTYSDAVCLIYVNYGYVVKLDSQGEGENIHNLLGLDENTHLIWDEKQEKVIEGTTQSTGTAFFISEDGKMATNLHVCRPWLFSKDAENIAQVIRTVLKVRALQENPLYDTYIPQVKVVGDIVTMGIIPNGLPFSNTNFIPCRELKGHDDTKKDVAIVQTENFRLPQGVNTIIDINTAADNEEELAQGKKVYSIGFPYGVSIGSTDKGLQNQIQSGTITQDRGEYEFGHNASSAGGASGSPIFNIKGKLIGIHHAGMTGVTGAQGFNMAIKAKYIKELNN
ncbi:MAG: FHA domain-containing protein [Prevotellaceae bacterium]|nr:FHA domain-containing protein [Prevotellaceae bacterium]